MLEEGERKIYGWTLFSPEEPNVRYTQKLEEKILLIVRVTQVSHLPLTFRRLALPSLAVTTGALRGLFRLQP